MRLYRWCGVVLALVGMAACGRSDPVAPPEPSPQALSGEVYYLERLRLPAGAELEVDLEDISVSDAAATVVASQRQAIGSAPPYQFELSYDAGAIDASNSYALRARIRLHGELLFTNTEFVDAFGEPPLRVLVRQLPMPVAELATSLQDQRWVLAELNGSRDVAGADGKVPDLILEGGSATEGRAGGFAGCNRYTGSYQLSPKSANDRQLSFGAMAATRMACAEGGELERNYLAMLALVNRYQLAVDALVLFDNELPLATFAPN